MWCFCFLWQLRADVVPRTAGIYTYYWLIYFPLVWFEVPIACLLSSQRTSGSCALVSLASDTKDPPSIGSSPSSCARYERFSHRRRIWNWHPSDSGGNQQWQVTHQLTSLFGGLRLINVVLQPQALQISIKRVTHWGGEKALRSFKFDLFLWVYTYGDAILHLLAAPKYNFGGYSKSCCATCIVIPSITLTIWVKYVHDLKG